MKKNSVGLLELETADLECFLEKTPLSPLGVNRVVNAAMIFELVLAMRAFLVPSTMSQSIFALRIISILNLNKEKLSPLNPLTIVGYRHLMKTDEPC